jgi:hypothetical protein
VIRSVTQHGRFVFAPFSFSKMDHAFAAEAPPPAPRENLAAEAVSDSEEGSDWEELTDQENFDDQDEEDLEDHDYAPDDSDTPHGA